MKLKVNEAKARLSQMIAAAERGEDVLITRRGQPVVRLVAMQPTTPSFRFGLLDGELGHPPAFLDPMTEAKITRWE